MDVEHLQADSAVLGELHPESSPRTLSSIETRASWEVAPGRIGVLLQKKVPRATGAVVVQLAGEPVYRRGRSGAAALQSAATTLQLGLRRRGRRSGTAALLLGLRRRGGRRGGAAAFRLRLVRRGRRSGAAGFRLGLLGCRLRHRRVGLLLLGRGLGLLRRGLFLGPRRHGVAMSALLLGRGCRW